MKKVLWGFILSAGASLIWSAGACATSYTIGDNTLSMWADHDQPALSYSTWSDVVGEPSHFDTFSIDVTWSGGEVVFDIFTNYDINNNSSLLYIADVALGVQGNGTYNYAVVLNGHDGLVPGLYSNVAWLTSYDFFGQSGSGYYGEKYAPLSSLQGYPSLVSGGQTYYYPPAAPPFLTKDPIVAIKNDSQNTPSQKAAFGTTQTLVGNGTTSPFYQYSFSFDTSLLVGLNDRLDVFWGTATCGNDAIEGSVPVPEPATFMLLGTGIAGLLGLRRKQRPNFT